MNIVIAAPNALIDEHHENLVLVAKEKPRSRRSPRLRARTCTSTTGLLILQISSLAFPAKIRIAFKR